MNILSPSILSADCARLGEQIHLTEEAGAKYLHIDIMDGAFVPSLSYGLCVVESLRKATKLFFDVHLMVVNPIRYVEHFAEAGADLLTVHLEACEDVAATLDAIHANGMKTGLALKPQTAISELEPYLDKTDMILVMAVNPGFGGQKYIENTTERIREARLLVEKSGLPIDIEVDGGINGKNVRSVMEAGANVIVSGSAIFNGDITENTRALMKVLEEEEILLSKQEKK